MSKKKYYVVWKGKEIGIFDKWEDCKRNVENFSSPIYRSFSSLEEAKIAFQNPPEKYFEKKEPAIQPIFDAIYGKPIIPSICVDGAHSSSSRQSEYQGVDTETGALLFKNGPFIDGTNNVMEFLALVHALALCKQQNWNLPIYSDSANAIKWVKNKKAATNLQKTPLNEQVFELIARAENWLKKNTYTTPIYKWETKVWGEIPADFGRK